MSLREAAQQALVDMACMRDMVAHPDNLQFIDKAINALRTALAEPEQEPVAWLQRRFVDNFPAPGYETCEATDYGAIPVYTHPPQRKPLTDEEILRISLETPVDLYAFARAIERAHGIGGEE